jgi:hypothetical protein
LAGGIPSLAANVGAEFCHRANDGSPIFGTLTGKLQVLPRDEVEDHIGGFKDLLPLVGVERECA